MILNANITLDLQFSPGLHVAIQKNDLQKVLLNLINNAVGAFITESSTAHVYRSNTITICTTRSFDSVLLSISDNGRGIPSEKIPSLFDLLANDQEKATGLNGTSMEESLSYASIGEKLLTIEIVGPPKACRSNHPAFPYLQA